MNRIPLFSTIAVLGILASAASMGMDDKGMGGMGNQPSGSGQGQPQGGMGQGSMGGMMDHMQKMHPSSAPPSSSHAPVPQCPPGTTVQMDANGQHICK